MIADRFVCVLAGAMLAGCAAPGAPPRYAFSDGRQMTSQDAELAYVQRNIIPDATSKVLNCPVRALAVRMPDYPADLRRDGQEGRVVVRFTVLPNGSVGEPTVVSSPSADLARVSGAAVRAWRFEPPLCNGKALSVTFEIPFLFVLRP